MTSAVTTIEEPRWLTLFEDFVRTAGMHEFSRSEVKRGLLGYFKDLVAEDTSYADAKNHIAKHPYVKESYWRHVFYRFGEHYDYRHCEIRLINGAIIARIQYENMMAAL